MSAEHDHRIPMDRPLMDQCGEWDDAIATSSAALSAADDADDADALVAARRAAPL
jgi:hypothetical protein